jgi:hypothetical protein
MSTKTTFKRIALVTVAALGFGVLTSVAPANADGPIAPTAITVGTIPTSGQVGVVHTTPISIAAPYTTAGSDTFTVMVKVTAAPTGSAFLTLATNGTTGSAATPGVSFDAGVYSRSGSTSVAAKSTISKPAASTDLLTYAAIYDGLTGGYLYTSAPRTTAGGSSSLNVNITPDVAGSYTVLVSTKNSGTGATYTGAAGELGVTYTFTTGKAVAAVSLSAVTGGSSKSSDVGQVMKVTLKDSAGALASLATGETVNVIAGGTTDMLKVIPQTAGVWAATTSGAVTANTTLVLGAAAFYNGVAYFTYNDSTASTGNVITATGSGLLSPTISTTLTTTVTSAATGILFAGSAITVSDGTATRPGSGHTAYTAGTPGTATASTASTSHSFTVTVAALAATSYFDVKVVDTSGDITGIVGQVFNQVLTVTYDATATSQTGTLTVGAALAVAGDSFTASILGTSTWGATADDGVTVTSADPAATSLRPLGQSLATGSAKTLYSSVAGSNALWATLYDQFGAVMASKAGTVSVTGRNATTTSTAFVTDASGRASFTVADAGTSATSNTQDTVTFTSTVSATVTINYGTSAASTITCLTGNEDDTATLKTYRDISASGTGTQAGAASLCTVTVKDANGGVLVGFPVTVTTASAGAAVVSTSATLYTGAAGTVAPSVYGWTEGTKTFTITAGTATKAVTVNYTQRTAADVRTISAVASGNIMVVTAKDRFGNVVPGVNIYATRTGNGLFGGGSNTANAITAGTNSGTTPTPANNGTAEFIFNAGSADSVVTFSVASAANTPDPEFGQTSSTVGKVCAGAACTQTAVTAYVAGTVYTAETGVGADFAAAGVNSVTAASAAGTDTGQTATDAAAEATDAANAATDAANAAAEAADAATAAAQDAADAVAALSAQVASLISGLKSQLTALTNLVIKIQKKVKA